MFFSSSFGFVERPNDALAKTMRLDSDDFHVLIIASDELKSKFLYNERMSFSGFNLSSKMVSALQKMGYVDPSPVQSAVIPKALRGVSLLAQSETGSGKTHAYLIPLIARTDMELDRPQSIIIAPTRELCRQIFDFARVFTVYYPHFRVRLYTPETEVAQNEEGQLTPPQMIIGTPGRLKDLLVDKSLFGLQNVHSVVLDEADMLLDLGYFEEIEALFALLKDPQTMVFSATLKPNLRDELLKFVKSDFEFESDHIQTASKVRHHLVDVKHVGTISALVSFLKIRQPYLCLVFASKKETVKEVYDGLKSNNFDALYFSGNLDDRSRRKALRDIKANRYSLIVCSDLLARGMDIPDVSDVVSIDLPLDLEFYYHRAGRTGRFGKDGDSWVFYNADTTERPEELLAAGVPFDFYTLKGTTLAKDPVGLAPKKKLSQKKELPAQEVREIKIAKALSREKRVKPMYKKKKQFAIDKVKKKYRRKAIQQSVRLELTKQWKAEAKKKNHQDD
jgi:ATP-dependent RNA helicase CshB